MPEAEYAVLGEVKSSALGQGVEVKKEPTLAHRFGFVEIIGSEATQKPTQCSARIESRAPKVG